MLLAMVTNLSILICQYDANGGTKLAKGDKIAIERLCYLDAGEQTRRKSCFVMRTLWLTHCRTSKIREYRFNGALNYRTKISSKSVTTTM